LGNELFDYKNNVEYALPETPHSVRTYPGSAATAMLALTPANNWTATIWMCGGTNLQPDQWTLDWNIAAFPADNTCISITPDISTAWQDEDPLPEARVMGNMIGLPDGRFVILNGIAKGTAGYGNTSWAVGQAFGTDPIYSPMYLCVLCLLFGGRKAECQKQRSGITSWPAFLPRWHAELYRSSSLPFQRYSST
jgi:hypothetical protein